MSILFTVDQANTILPKVKKRFDEILFCKNNVIDIQEELQNLSDSNCSFEKFITKKQQLNHAVTSLYSMIQKLEDMGVMIKSVDEGLLDFPSIRYDEDKWLCWKFGENQVKFWHGKEEGFMGRKPIPQEGFEYVDDFADLR